MILIKFGICFSYFIIGGLATTNIVRLLKGNTLNIFDSECKCPNCGMKISVLNQTPIVSYFINKGKCKNCESKIPIDSLFLEIVVFVGMLLISVIGDFSPKSVFFSFIYYEIVRIINIIKYGHREKSFLKQYFCAIIAMAVYFVLLEFLACLLLVV